MISVHLLTQGEVAQRLTGIGCNQVASEVDGCSAWKTAWGFHFLVPEIPPDSMTPEYKLDDILADIQQTKPVCH